MTNYTIKNGKLNFKFQKKLYNIEELELAHNDISDKCSMIISQSKDLISVDIESKEDLRELAKLFLYRLSEHQIRKILQKENSKIKDLIVEQAFKPICNLKDRIDE